MGNITNLLSGINLNSLITIFDIQIALAIIIVAFLLKGVFSRIVIRIIYFITKRKKVNPKEDPMYPVLKTIFLVIGAYIAIYIIPKKSEVVKHFINQTFEIVTILCVAKLITSLISKDSWYFRRLLNKTENSAVNDFVCKMCRGLVWVVTGFIVLSELGWDLNGLVTGLGLASAVIALAAQELVKNLLSGISILTDKPFVLGDWIEVGKFSGSVVDITFRSTRIKTNDNSLVTIPNSVITSEYVINWNRLKSRRLDLVLNLELNTSTEKIRKILKEIRLVLATNPNVIEETIQVNFSKIANASNDITMFMYINETDYIKFLNIKEEILCSLLLLVEKENIELAYPTQTIYLKNHEGETVNQ